MGDPVYFWRGGSWHAHSLEELNAGLVHRGMRCDDCPPREDYGSAVITKIDRESGTITLEDVDG